MCPGINSDSNLYLADILVEPNSDDSIIEAMHCQEYREILFRKLFSKLSLFEKKVFMLYAQKLSYSEMSEKLYDILEPEEKESILNKYAEKKVNYILRSKAKKHIERREEITEFIKDGWTKEDLAEDQLDQISDEEKKEIVMQKTIKSIDNALSRIKTKAKETFEKHG